jgi:hypothetical protein
VLLPLYAHFSHPFWTGQPLAYPAVQKSGAAATDQVTYEGNDKLIVVAAILLTTLHGQELHAEEFLHHITGYFHIRCS